MDSKLRAGNGSKKGPDDDDESQPASGLTSIYGLSFAAAFVIGRLTIERLRPTAGRTWSVVIGGLVGFVIAAVIYRVLDRVINRKSR